MELNLKGKRVLITGSTRGIGLAAAELFLEEGARVILNGTRQETLNGAVSLLSRQGHEAGGFLADVSDPAQIKRLFHDVEELAGGLDILLNNAGIYPFRTPIAEIGETEYDQTLNLNLKSVLLCSQQAVNLMRKKGAGGVILNASSFAAIMPSVGAGLYAAAKAAVVNLTRTMAAEFAPWNIRVNAYLPGVIETDMTSTAVSSRKEQMISQIALQRLGRAKEAAAPLVFLASSRASYITGAALEVSGGKFAVQNPSAAW